MKINVQERVREILDLLEDFSPGIERDVRMECKEDWTADYAIFALDIVEPSDHDERRYLDTFRFMRDVASFVQGKVSKNAILAVGRNGGAAAPNGTLVVHLHAQSNGWGAEIEVYRVIPKALKGEYVAPKVAPEVEKVAPKPKKKASKKRA